MKLKIQFLLLLADSAELDLQMSELAKLDGQMEIHDRFMDDARRKTEIVVELTALLKGKV